MFEYFDEEAEQPDIFSPEYFESKKAEIIAEFIALGYEVECFVRVPWNAMEPIYYKKEGIIYTRMDITPNKPNTSLHDVYIKAELTHEALMDMYGEDNVKRAYATQEIADQYNVDNSPDLIVFMVRPYRLDPN